MPTTFGKASVIALTLILLAGSVRADSNWPGWRGPSANGHSAESGLPTKWSADSVTWKAPLKGRGQSSATIWGDRIFLTTAVDNGKQRVVFCVDRNTGQTLWEKTAWTGEAEPSHHMNGWASPTCATDGERVYAFFGKGGLHCYTVEGEQVWSKDLGPFTGPWGTASCPVLVGDMVIQNCDADQDAYITAVNKKTGEAIWKTKRENFRGWSTPVLIKTAKRVELVTNGHTGVRAYDPVTGKDLWFCKGFRGRGTPTVAAGNGLIHVINGQPGDIYAVKPGGSGTVTDTHMAWHTTRKGGRDLPSPLVVGKYLLGMNIKGILTCYDSPTGKQLWQERIGGNFSAAPVSFAGLAFFISEAGETVVVKPGDKPNIVATNKLNAADDEIFRASITPSDGQLFVRSDQVLYCIGKRKAAK